MKEQEAATEIIKILKENNIKAVFAGGVVRDFILGLESHDIDIAVEAPLEKIKPLFSSWVEVGESFGIFIVNFKGFQFEIASTRKEEGVFDGRHPEKISFATLEEDAHRRDLTINSLFFDPIEEKVLDFTDGKKDIKNKVINFVGEPSLRLKEDRLRALRAVRFFSKLNFDIEEKTLKALNGVDISNLSFERIRDEFFKILLTPKPSIGIKKLNELNLLSQFLPEVNDIVNEPHSSRWHFEGGVFTHSLMVMDEVRKKTENPVTILSGLLHDIGKIKTRQWDEKKENWTNNNHDNVGSEMSLSISNRLKLSNKEKEKIFFVIKNHMKIKNVHKMKKSKIAKLCNDDNIEDLIVVAESNDNCSIPMNAIDKKDKNLWMSKILEFKEKNKGWKITEPFINGKDLINMGFKPGPNFKMVLNEVFESQLNDKVQNKEQALKTAKQLFKGVL